MTKKLKIVAAVSLSLLAGASLFAADIFVTTTGGGDLSGSSWSNAINGGENNLIGLKLRDVITNAVANSATEVNVYLASGTYTTSNQVTLSSITIPVKISGGYLGTTDGSFERSETPTTFARHSSYNIRFIQATSLSDFELESIVFRGGGDRSASGGKVGGALYLVNSDTRIINCSFESNLLKGKSNTYARGGAIYVTGGSLFVDGSEFLSNALTGNNCTDYGGAICSLETDVIVINSSFEGNYAHSSQSPTLGGAIAINGFSAVISNCVFRGNYVYCSQTFAGAVAAGAGISVRSASRFDMIDCKFFSNCAYYGNAVTRAQVSLKSGYYFDDYNTADGVMTAVVTRCVFDSSVLPTKYSRTKSDILLNGGNLFLTNCLVAGVAGTDTTMTNLVRNQRYSCDKIKDLVSGKYAVNATSYMELVNCTIADGKGAGAVRVGTDSDMVLKNCIVYGNTVEGVVNASSVEYTCSQEEQEGEGNFVADPHWTGAPYYHLITKMKNGYIDDGYFGGAFDNEKAEASSPCIDAGAPNSPNHIFEPHARGRRINLGAYGGTPWASKTYYQLGSILYLK